MDLFDKHQKVVPPEPKVVKPEIKNEGIKLTTTIVNEFKTLEEALEECGHYDNVENAPHSVELTDNGKVISSKKFQHYRDSYGSRKVVNLKRHD